VLQASLMTLGCSHISGATPWIDFMDAKEFGAFRQPTAKWIEVGDVSSHP